MDIIRDEIRSRERVSQIRNFKGMHFGSILPTDIDWMIEYKNKAYVFGETKFYEIHLKAGQLVIFSTFENKLGDIDVANTKVIYYRSTGDKDWKSGKDGITVRQLVDDFLGAIS